jgi:hypothetical protein
MRRVGYRQRKFFLIEISGLCGIRGEDEEIVEHRTSNITQQNNMEVIPTDNISTRLNLRIKD